MASRVELHRANIAGLLRGPAGPLVRTFATYGRRSVNVAKRTAPVDRGTYRASIDYLVFVDGDDLVLRVGSALHYARYIAQGTGIYGPKRRPIRPVHRKALKFKPKGSRVYVFAKQVKGSPPNHHLIEAVRATVPWPIHNRI